MCTSIVEIARAEGMAKRGDDWFPLSQAVLHPVRTVMSDEKKLSIAALSQSLPGRLIEQTTPLPAMSRWNCSLVHWLPRSE